VVWAIKKKVCRSLLGTNRLLALFLKDPLKKSLFCYFAETKRRFLLGRAILLFLTKTKELCI